MKVFLIKTLIFFTPILIIFGVLTAGYIIYDPFKLVRKYDIDSIYKMNLNRDYVSTEIFLKHYKEQKYDSFIFGSSRSLAYRPNVWKKHLGEKIHPFSFDASKEDIFGIYHKIKFLDSKNTKIKNAMILVDTDYEFFNLNKKENNFLVKEHPALLNNSFCEWIDFQKAHFEGYLHFEYIVSFYGHQLFGIDNTHTRRHRLKSVVKIEYPTNWLNGTYYEQVIDTTYPEYFKSKRFYKRSEKIKILDPQIKDDQTKILTEIKNLLDKHHTDYKIIINPIYNQYKYHPSDLEKLKHIFGKTSVYDFSGKNHFTRSKYNYYEDSHFRVHVGDSIMNYIYQDYK